MGVWERPGHLAGGRTGSGWGCRRGMVVIEEEAGKLRFLGPNRQYNVLIVLMIPRCWIR